MYKIRKLFADSYCELKKPRTIAVAAMLIALNVALRIPTVVITDFLQIRFLFVAVAIAGALFGPVVAAMVGVAGDLIGGVLLPSGPFSFGFVLSALVTGLIFGILLYQGEPRVGRISAAIALNTIVVNLCLNSLWLSILYGKAIYVYIAGRVFKEAILIPINVLLLFALFGALKVAFRQIKRI